MSTSLYPDAIALIKLKKQKKYQKQQEEVVKKQYSKKRGKDEVLNGEAKVLTLEKASNVKTRPKRRD